MDDSTAIKCLTGTIQSLLLGKSISKYDENFILSIKSEPIKDLCLVLNNFISVYACGVDAIQDLAKGNLAFSYTVPNPIFGSLKDLQAKLKHLVWQTQRLAEGDYNQQIDFLGDFSISYNKLIQSLKEKQELELELRESELKLAKLLSRQKIKNQKLSKKLKYIYNHSINAVAFFDIEGDQIRFSSCNNLWANSLGFSSEDLKDQEISNICDAETNTLYRKYIFKAIDSGEPIQDYIRWRGMDLHLILIPIKDEQTEETPSCAAFVYDITEKLQTELKMHETEEKFFNIFNNSTDSIIVMSPDLKVVEVNNRFFQLSGIDLQQTPYQITDLNMFIPKKYHHQLLQRIELFKIGEILPSFECEVYHSSGKAIPVELNSSVFSYNNSPMILCIIRDISVRKDLERKLAQVGIRIETRERRKLATDLHDNVGPLLSSMNMYLSSLSRKPELKKHSELLSDIRRILKETIASVREISNNINPQVLNSYGLSAALTLFFETKKKLVNIKLENNLEDFRFSEIKEIMIYNIIKEAFNNSIKYSEATDIEVNITKYEERIALLYIDNGIGFDLEEKLTTVSESLGLFSIINRIKNLDGNYKMTTSPGNGFKLEIDFSTEN